MFVDVALNIADSARGRKLSTKPSPPCLSLLAPLIHEKGSFSCLLGSRARSVVRRSTNSPSPRPISSSSSSPFPCDDDFDLLGKFYWAATFSEITGSIHICAKIEQCADILLFKQD